VNAKDYMKPEVGVAVAVTAALTSPRMRGMLRRGAVYGMAGVLMASDAIASAARSTTRAAQKAAASAESASRSATEQAEVDMDRSKEVNSAEANAGE
jgi:hypothetical protein